MTEHKFTDEEIIAHLLAYCGRMCGKCEVAKSICCDSCVILRIRDGIDLINRQKAEVAYWMDAVANAKREAVKEFSDRLKTYYRNLNSNTAAGLVEYHIEKIKEEMLCEK